MIKVAIIGWGYVGKGMGKLFEDRVDVIYDPFNPEIKSDEKSKAQVNACDLAVVCVPTQPNPDQSCNTSIVEETIGWLETPLILIKSTIEPGTTKRLVEKTGKKIAFSPEYMGEGKYFIPPWRYPDPLDPKKHTFVIVGGERETTKPIVDIFTRIMGPHVTYAQTDSTTAELVKYMENMWIGTKVVWSNEMYNVCEALGVDYREARELWSLDPRVDKMHTAVFPDARGFGGKCIPKDNRGLIRVSQKHGYDPKFLKEVINSNARMRKEEDTID